MPRKREDVNSKKYQYIIKRAIIKKGVKKYKSKHLGFFTNFKTNRDDTVYLKAGISFVGMERAKKNLQNEIPNWNFRRVVELNKSVWEMP